MVGDHNYKPHIPKYLHPALASAHAATYFPFNQGRLRLFVTLKIDTSNPHMQSGNLNS
jgi:hypothetical protein